MQEIKFGIIGTGAVFTLSHAKSIQNITNARIVSIYDINRDRAVECSKNWKIQKIAKNLDELINDKEINAIIIATPNNTHKEIAIKAANQGKHIFCEKPISVNLEDAYQMIETCKKNNVSLQIGFNQRYWEQVQIVKTLLDINFIGEIHSFRSVYSEKWDAYPAATQYRYNLDQSGGGTIIDLTVHRIDLIRYLLGEYKSIVAEIKNSAIPRKVDDNVYILANMLSGSTGVISSDRYSPAIGDGTDLYGTEGAIHFVTETINPFHNVPLAVYTEKKLDEIPSILKNNFYPSAWWKEFKGGWITLQPERKNPYEKELISFCNNIIENKPPEVNGEDGLKALEVIIASYISKNKKKWIELPLDKNSKTEIPKY